MKTLEQKFWHFVSEKGNPGGCWLWTGCIHPTKYGHFNKYEGRSKMVRAHRLSWELMYGPIPKGLCVLHKCDIRHCVRPSHLFLGTKAENTADMVAKNRQAYGERHGQSRLSEDQVTEIKALLRGTVGVTWISRKFRVARQTISAIKAKRNWAWLDGSTSIVQ